MYIYYRLYYIYDILYVYIIYMCVYTYLDICWRYSGNCCAIKLQLLCASSELQDKTGPSPITSPISALAVIKTVHRPCQPLLNY
jgi:hypothetical protein